MSKDDKSYPVGYGKPPVHTRFQKGQSGNRAGRSKGRVKRADLRDAFDEALNALVAVNDNGRRSKRRKFKVLATQTVNDAIKGDRDARKTVVAVAMRKAAGAEQANETSGQSAEELRNELNVIFDEIVGRLAANGEAGSSTDNQQTKPRAENKSREDGADAQTEVLKDAS